jgi:protein dithiol oxidoreductase (disulfide-forming)
VKLLSLKDRHMKRREFSQSALALSACAATAFTSSSAFAADAVPAEGTNYVKLAQPAPTSAPAGKIEVVEFFWYGCPHCFHFEPSLVTWLGKLPSDVVFKRVPVAFRENPFAIHQRLFYTLEGMGLLPTLHSKVFHAIHVENNKLDTPESITDFVVKQGVDKAKFLALFNAFSMPSKLKQARALAEAYKLDGVPTVGIAGRYFTSVSLNGTSEKTLATVNFLLAKVRTGK